MDYMVQGFLGTVGNPRVDSYEDDNYNQSPFGSWRPPTDPTNHDEHYAMEHTTPAHPSPPLEQRQSRRRRSRSLSPMVSRSRSRPIRKKYGNNDDRGVHHYDNTDNGTKAKVMTFEKQLQAIQNQKDAEYREKLDLKLKQINKTHRQQRIDFEAEKKELLNEIEMRSKESVSLQKQINELNFFRDLDSNDVTTMKDEVKECDSKINIIEEECEREKEKIHDTFTSQMDILARQLQKMQKRHDKLLSETNATRKEDEDEVRTLQKKNSEIFKEKEDAAETAKAELHEIMSRHNDEREALQQLKDKHEEDGKKLDEGNEKTLDILRRRYAREQDQLADSHKEEIDKISNDWEEEKETLEKKILNSQQKLEKIQTSVDSVEAMTKIMISQHQEVMDEKVGEISSLKSKLKSVEKTVLNYRGSAKSEMDVIKGEVGKSRTGFQKRLYQAKTEKGIVEQELKTAKLKLIKTKKQMDHLVESLDRKSESLKIKEEVFVRAKEEHIDRRKIHDQVLKERDSQHSKEKEGWKICEKRLRDEISELRRSLSSSSDVKDSRDLRTLVKRMNSEKANLQSKLASLEGKSIDKVTIRRRKIQPTENETDSTKQRTNNSSSSSSSSSNPTQSVVAHSQTKLPTNDIIIQSSSTCSTNDDQGLVSGAAPSTSKHSTCDENLSVSSKKSTRSLSRKRTQILNKKFSRD